jgi:hypothetical protein
VAGLELGTKCASTYSQSRYLPLVQVAPSVVFVFVSRRNTLLAWQETSQETSRNYQWQLGVLLTRQPMLKRNDPQLTVLSSATNVLSTSRDRSPSPKVVPFEDMDWKRSNNPVELDAPPITMTAANQAHVHGLVAFYPTLKIRHCLYLERT